MATTIFNKDKNAARTPAARAVLMLRAFLVVCSLTMTKTMIKKSLRAYISKNRRVFFLHFPNQKLQGVSGNSNGGRVWYTGGKRPGTNGTARRSPLQARSRHYGDHKLSFELLGKPTGLPTDPHCLFLAGGGQPGGDCPPAYGCGRRGSISAGWACTKPIWTAAEWGMNT